LSGVKGGFYVSKIYTEKQAIVVAHVRQNGRVVSLKVKHEDSENVFSISRGVGSGVRRRLPKPGSVIVYKSMGEKLENCPKMPIFVKVVHFA